MLLRPEPPPKAATLGNRFRAAWTTFGATAIRVGPRPTSSRLVQIFDVDPVVTGYPEDASRRLLQNHKFQAMAADRVTLTPRRPRTGGLGGRLGSGLRSCVGGGGRSAQTWIPDGHQGAVCRRLRARRPIRFDPALRGNPDHHHQLKLTWLSVVQPVLFAINIEVRGHGT